ncbi:hypothetical protein CC86DRAFT_472674 [Ophiobolus disseminans]|uniref:Uncharacterized protein n=1 Tax=Ophiobolus disseminans TaxID=1469910 RepID=A0A6A6ZD07_9PLEO|nr:hypothetical protein CC86DRAFT_472674 [Ophiobolus disseminans]
MKFLLPGLPLAFATAAVASPLQLEKRQCSTTWRYQDAKRAPPGNYKAFDLGGCTSQLSFNKDQYISVQWAFEATYADGSRAEHKPFRDFDTFGVSDTFYPYLGNNFITRYPGNSAFTAVHEFTNVCSGGQAPVSWRFYTTWPECFTSGQIPPVSGATRPAKVSGVSLRRANDAGDFQVSWSAVPTAAAYSAIVEYPTGTDEGTSTSVATTTRRQDVARKVIVHAVNSQGLWSFTNDVPPVVAGW